MRVEVREGEKGETYVVIFCTEIDEEVRRIKNKLLEKKVSVVEGNEEVLIDLKEIFYIESVDKKTFIYRKKEVNLVKLRLYEFEEKFRDEDFMRISKNTIVNLNKIIKISPDLGRRLILTLENEERLIVSRSFVKGFKNALKGRCGNEGE